MASATLKSRIDKLWNALGGSSRPDNAAIRGILAEWSHLADALESGQSAVEAEQKIAALEVANKELESKLQISGAQIGQLQSALEAAKEELRRIQQQDESNEPLSGVEVRILECINRGSPGEESFLVAELRLLRDVVSIALRDLRKSDFLKDEALGLQPCYALTKKAKAWLGKNHPQRPSAFS